MGANKPFWWWIATWFGAGLSPFASGTAGSLAALPFAYIIQSYYGNPGLLIAAVMLTILGIWASDQFVRKAGKGNDPGEIVVDEVAAQWLLLAFLPFTWQGYIVGFLTFRIFDVIKPWPVSLADRKVHGGLGVMLDDIMAALYPVVLYWVMMQLGGESLLQPLMDFLRGV